MVSIVGTAAFAAVLPAKTGAPIPSSAKPVEATKTDAPSISELVTGISDDDALLYDRTMFSTLQNGGGIETNTNNGAEFSEEELQAATTWAMGASARVDELMSAAGIDTSNRSAEAIAIVDASRVQQAPQLASSIRISQLLINNYKLQLEDNGLDAQLRENIESGLKTAEKSMSEDIKIVKRNYQITGEIAQIDDRGLYVLGKFALFYKGNKIY